MKLSSTIKPLTLRSDYYALWLVLSDRGHENGINYVDTQMDHNCSLGGDYHYLIHSFTNWRPVDQIKNCCPVNS